MFKIFPILFLFFIITTGCNGNESPPEEIQFLSTDSLETLEEKEQDYILGYQINEPDQTFELAPILHEISGLGFDEPQEFLYANQDEKGIIFKLSKETGEILEHIPFHKDGDYEGIEVVGDKIYVLKSTGTIYEICNAGQATQEMKKTVTFLNKENDVEGLAYDKAKHRLLLACKGIPAIDEPFEVIRHKKVIYAFDLASGVLQSDPVFVVQLADIRKFLEQSAGMSNYEKLVEFFSGSKENLTFNPSGIAIHPMTGDIYILSSKGKILVVLNEAGKVVHIEKLEKSVHTQPEGIAFEKNGTLYISNEGKNGKPKLHRFNYNNPH